MKHLILIIAFAFVLVSCKEESNPVANTNTAKSVTFTVTEANWELSSGIAVYQKFIPEITKRISNNICYFV